MLIYLFYRFKLSLFKYTNKSIHDCNTTSYLMKSKWYINSNRTIFYIYQPSTNISKYCKTILNSVTIAIPILRMRTIGSKEWKSTTNQCRIKIPTVQNQPNPCDTSPNYPNPTTIVDCILGSNLGSTRPIQ